MNDHDQPGIVHCCDPDACSWEPSTQATPQGQAGQEEPSQPPSGIEARERSVLQELGREEEAQVAFQGLRRELDLHQQQLTRTLTRLEQRGLVAGGDEGYKLTEEGYGLLTEIGGSPRRCGEVALAQVILPPGLGVEPLAKELAGRWFQGLRWYGQRTGTGETTLIWQTDPEGQRLRLTLTGATATLTVDGWVEPEADLFSAVHTLLAAATQPFGQASSAS